MRIRLIVQRHSLPPAHVLWTVGVTRPPYTAAGASVTVSQLLEQVNDVIPLESEEWGLEDYAVEVEGFECLHFSELAQVLKEDDEVCIRPLQTSDLRFRRISGRHQITADGRHLIDGVAFGRPFLRRTERPAIRIPPRKRRRVMYDDPEDDSNEDIYNDRQVMVHAGLEDSDIAPTESEDDEAEEDYVRLGQEDEDLIAEVEDIHKELQEESGEDQRNGLRDTATAFGDTARTRPRRSTRSQGSKEGLGLQDADILKLTDENGRPYPGGHNNPLLELYSQGDPPRPDANTGKRKRKSSKGHEAARQSPKSSGKDSAATQPVNRRESSASLKSVRFEGDALTTPPTTVLDAEDSEDTEDEDFEPPADAKDETDESDKENAEPKAGEEVSREIMSSESDSSSSSSESEDDSEATSSSGSSSTSSSEAETEVEQPSTGTSKTKAQVDETSSSGTSFSSSASASQDQETPKKTTGTASKSCQSFTSTQEQAKKVSQASKAGWQSLTLSKRQYNKIRKVKEPERARRWLKAVLNADSKGQIVQLTLWQAYQAQFLHDYMDGNPPVTATDLIIHVSDLFEGAYPAHVFTPWDKYVVKGVRPRDHSIGPSSQSAREIVPPGQGKDWTRKRNARRKAAKKFKRFEKAGEQVAQSTSTDVTAKAEKSTEVHETTDLGSTTARPIIDTTDPAFDARRQALLKSVASGGVEVSTRPSEGNIIPDADAMDSSMSIMPKEPVQDSSTNEISASRRVGNTDAVPLEQTASQEATKLVVPFVSQSTGVQGQTEPTRPRSKVDLASSRRLLFGALGLRTPKTKEDEKALQAKLMKDVRPIKQAQTNKGTSQGRTEAAAGDDESWRVKIDLRAVECCYDGIELSTPPFPFVQRWDPQQKRGYKKVDTSRNSGKSRKRKRNSARYYDDGTEEQGLMPDTKRGKSVSPPGALNTSETHRAEIQEAQMPDAQPTSSDVNQGAVNEQLLRESQEAAVNARTGDRFQEDLPPLPDDLTAYAELSLKTAKPGTIIAFKKLDMSVETNWQPRVSEYRTAIVDECKDDGTLYMTLAFRDRPNQETPFDPETGERVYYKFEMPGYDNENEEGAEGHLELPLAELIEPKIVQAPEPKQDEAAISAIRGGGEEYANEALTATIGETEPKGVSDYGEFDESWEGFEESGEVVQPEEAHQAEELEEIEELGCRDEIQQSEETVQVVETEHLGEVKEAIPPTVDGLDEVSYPDLGNKLKELVKKRVEEVSEARPDLVSTLPRVDELSEAKAATNDASDQLRQEISELIKDAGWRSSIHVPIDEKPSPHEEAQLPHQAEIEVNVHSSPPPSPKFNGFNHNSGMEDTTETLPAEIPETYQEPLEIADSVPAQSVDHVESPNKHSVGDNIADDDAAPPDNDEDSLLCDAQASQQIAPKRFSSSMSPPLIPRILQSQPRSQNGGSQIRESISPPRVANSKSKAHSGGRQSPSSVSPPKASRSRTKARNGGPQAKVNAKSHFNSDGMNSEEDFPTLEKVFASRISSLQQPSSQDSTKLTIKDEDSQVVLRALPRHKASQKSQKSQTTKSTKSSSINSPLPILSDDDDPSHSFVFSSQIPPGSQIVDLTLSSDPVEPSDSAYEGDSSLPNGPGWITKLRSSQRARSVGKSTERRSNGGVAMIGR